MQLNDVEHGKGSIPARAGEPAQVWDVYCDEWVYPRACGGTPALDDLGALQVGLSPRVRGNRVAVDLTVRDVGSIPARAGEPDTSQIAWVVDRVYPRACGGTDLLDDAGEREKGLSPRVRGNRR